MTAPHVPVLLDEVIAAQIRGGLLPAAARGRMERYIDETWLNAANQPAA